MAQFILPDVIYTRSGQIRRLGVELEFGGVSLPEAAEAVRAAFDGQIRQDHDHHFTIATSLGDFTVTFDSSLLSERKLEQHIDRIGLGDGVKEAVEGVLRRIGDNILPLEVTTPPIPVTRLDEINRLEQALRQQRAEGTRSGVFYAFALQFNPEAADPRNPAEIVYTLRSFLLLYHWLFREADVDRLRRLLPFINPFPEEYARLVVDLAYSPALAELIDDYVRFSPTRNRLLDLLPILAFNDAGLLDRPELAGQKVGPRPTYHYRLPNSLIDDPTWSIAQEWEQWVLIERLAGNRELMERWGQVYLDWQGGLLEYLEDRWVQMVQSEWVPVLRSMERLSDAVPIQL
jgi:hypothetical protein